MSGRATDDKSHEPATLFRVMQTAIAEGLRERYAPPRKMSHQLLVLMMQMNDRTRRERAEAEQAAEAERKVLTGEAGKRPDAVSPY
jgi:hypothetical protein